MNKVNFVKLNQLRDHKFLMSSMIRLINELGRDIMLINIVTKLGDDLDKNGSSKRADKFNLGINQLRGNNFFRSDMDNLSGY